MSDKNNFYTPKERRPIILRSCSILFCAGTILLCIFRDKIGIEKGDLMIMAGISLLLLTCLMQGRRAEKQLKISDEELRKMREEIGKDDYNTDIYFK